MISTNFTTNITGVTDVARAFNNSFDGLLILVLLFFFFIMIGIFVYSWNQNNPIGSFLYSSSIVTLITFFLTLIIDSVGDRLVDFSTFIFWLVITSLIFVLKKLTD